MKATSTITTALSLTIAFLAFASPASAQSADSKKLSKADDTAVRKVVTDFEKSWNTHDMKFTVAVSGGRGVRQ